MTSRPGRLAIVLTLAAFTAAACTAPAADPAESTGAVASPSNVPSDPDPTLLPLAWFMGRNSDPELDLIWDAYTALVSRCMASLGFETPEFPDESDLIQPLRYWYGLIDAEEAQTAGYTGLDAAARVSAALAEENELSDAERGEALFPDPARREAYLIALYGPEGGVTRVPVVDPITSEEKGLVGIDQGCRGQAQAEVFGGVESYLNYQQTQAWLQVAVLNIRQAAENVEPARDTGQLWLDCMSRAGFPPNHPFWPSEVAFVAEEMADFLGAIPAIGANWPVLPEPRPSPEEIKMAVADVTCKEESGWTMLVFTEEYRRQDELAAAAAEFIQQGQKIRAEAVERARTILGEG